ncbi:MAG: DUF4123 domain-containing protein [Myxococcota bacterium]
MAELNVDRVIRRTLESDWGGCPPEQWGQYCVVDGARSSQIQPMATRAGEDWACLYDGRLPPVLARAAPYLVRLDANSRFTRMFYEEGWGNSWGIVLRCTTSLEATRRHLRTLNYVTSEDRRKLLFRFYDPRVLRAFLPTCSKAQLRKVFGPIEAFIAEDQPSQRVLTFQRDSQGQLDLRRDDLSG